MPGEASGAEADGGERVESGEHERAEVEPPADGGPTEAKPPEGGEEAQARPERKAPRQPTASELASHNLTHIPYRSWCDHCVECFG